MNIPTRVKNPELVPYNDDAHRLATIAVVEASADLFGQQGHGPRAPAMVQQPSTKLASPTKGRIFNAWQ